jgi:glyoxylase-like metal-dependent hydrolase (beta-lactamase superfamily II)
MHTTRPDPALRGLTVLERGWLSSNNVLLHGQGAGAVLVDSGHLVHAAQTVALVGQALAQAGDDTLALLVNTHLHSDHCGGNATVQRAWPCPIRVPPGEFDAAAAWDEAALSYQATGQLCERFTPDSRLAPGERLLVGGRTWQALAAPGHDPHSIMLFDDAQGVLISADALWEHGFGVVFPELEGEQAFDEVAASLDLIESLRPAWVIPGHGRPFQDAAGALQRARQRLAGFVADPARHSRHALRVLVKFHLMEVRRQPWPELLAWFEATPLCRAVWQRLGRPAGSLRAFGEQTVNELLGSGALAQDQGVVLDVG